MRKIAKRRVLPLPGEVLVSLGDQVLPDTPVARISFPPGIPWVIPAARHLGIPEASLPSHVAVKVGDRVQTKDLLAFLDTALYREKELLAPISGIVEEISPLSGRIVIREEFGREDPPITVNVADIIGVKVSDVPGSMLVHQGQEVKEGQLIAKKGELQAFFTKTASAPVSGVIDKIDGSTGRVTISRPWKQVVVGAFISGQVASIIPDYGCVVETVGARIQGIFGVGKESFGPIRVASRGRLTAEDISEDHRGAIVVGGALVTDEAIMRALRVGVRGIVAGTVNYITLSRSLGVRVGVGITGQEDIGLTMVLTEGFGELPMQEGLWRTLVALQGKAASVSGATQVRAGAVRPEVIVPLPDYQGALAQDEETDGDLAVGESVRIVADPYFGAPGVVLEVVREPRTIPTEALTSVCMVRLDTGEEVLVPRANLEFVGRA